MKKSGFADLGSAINKTLHDLKRKSDLTLRFPLLEQFVSCRDRTQYDRELQALMLQIESMIDVPETPIFRENFENMILGIQEFHSALHELIELQNVLNQSQNEDLATGENE